MHTLQQLYLFHFVTVHKPQDEQIRFYIDLLNETNLVIDEQGII